MAEKTTETPDLMGIWSKFKKWEKLSIIGGALYLVGLYLPFFQPKYTGEWSAYFTGQMSSVTYSQYTGGIISIIVLLVGIVGIASPLLRIFAKGIKCPLPSTLRVFVFGAVGLILPLYAMLFSIKNDIGPADYAGSGFSISYEYGAFTLLAGAAIMIYAGFLSGGAKDFSSKIKEAQQKVAEKAQSSNETEEKPETKKTK